MIRIAIFASGAGTNAERLIERLRGCVDIQVARVYANRDSAGVLERARQHEVPSRVFSRSDLHSTEVLKMLEIDRIDFVVLAGFLLKVPAELVAAFKGRMLNLHPALLPRFGGKGMYGAHIHAAIFEAISSEGLCETGITLHWVTSGYDEGATIFQARTELTAEDTPSTIADKIRVLECKHFAPEVERTVRECFSLGVRSDDCSGAC